MSNRENNWRLPNAPEQLIDANAAVQKAAAAVGWPLGEMP